MAQAFTIRERLGITILLFILKMVNPTTYSHQIDQLRTELDKLITEEQK